MVILSLAILVFTLASVLLLLRLYCRLTLGRCECDQDMTGKTILITGASAGIGKTTALDLARRNARVLMACRNLEKAEKVKSEIITATGNSNVEIKLLDLESFDSVRTCAQNVIKTEKRLDVLINNAGCGHHLGGKTKDGWEKNMQTNHLGHFLLTLLLLGVRVSSLLIDCNMVFATLAILVFSLASVLLLLKLYCKLTLGRCECDQDMTGKTVLITGASAGIGKATALDLARRNARVLMACRNMGKAEKVKSEIIAATGNSNVDIKLLDLESFESVHGCAEDVIKTEKRLDVLINNAGCGHHNGCKTSDGWEKNMQTNYLGHFLLTLLLLDLLKKSKPSRIINVSSLTYLLAILDIEDMDGSKHYKFLAHLGNLYYRSKLAIILFTTELARRLDGTSVTVNVLHPGLIHTDLFYHSNHPTMSIFWFFMRLLGKNPEEGAQTTLYLAVHPDVEKTTGKYFSDCQETDLIGKAKDKALARKLFEISEKIVGESYKD